MKQIAQIDLQTDKWRWKKKHPIASSVLNHNTDTSLIILSASADASL